MSTITHLPPQEALPHRRMEAWKWTDVRAALAKPPVEQSAPDGSIAAPALPKNAIRFCFEGGKLDTLPDLPAGLRLVAGKAPAQENIMPMAALAGKGAPVHYTLFIEAGMDTPLVFRFNGAGACYVNVVLAKGGACTITEYHALENGFANTAIAYDLDANAVLTRLVYQHGSAEAVQIVSARVALGQDAQFDQYVLGFGARLARLETRLSYTGENARARLNGAYMLDENRHCDQTSHVDHEVENCITRQLVRGVVKDRAKGVFQGKFFVGREGQHTDAVMAHDALLLNAGASVNAKPELEIYADDVACAHGNTTGALDAGALFYMRQRGLDEAQAKALLIKAFLSASFDDLNDDIVRGALMEPIELWLEGAL